MIDFLAWFQSFTPAATGIWVFGGSSWVVLGAYIWRERRLDRKLSIEDREAKRNGFTAQLDQVQHAYAELLSDFTRLRSEYDAYRRLCQDETESLRRTVIDFEFLVSGFKRKLDDWQTWITRQGLAIPPELLLRVESAFERKPKG